MIDQKFIEAVSEEIKQDLENNGIPREMVDNIPDPELRDRLAEKWLNPGKLWYAVPQQKLELKYAINEEREKILEEFKRLVNEDIADSYIARDAGY